MPADSLKIILSNILAESISWANEPVGMTKPPALTVGGATTYANYTNLTGAAVLELLRDGEQDRPVFFTSATAQIKVDFGAAYAPGAVAMINHNCFLTGDRIDIYHSPDDITYTLQKTITTTERSVSRFFPLRQNDAWVNAAAVSRRYWRVELVKSAGAPYLGELVFAPQNSYGGGVPRAGLLEFTRAPVWPLTLTFSPERVVHRLVSGSPIHYQKRGEIIEIPLEFSFRELVDPLDFFAPYYYILHALIQSPQRQVLILPNLSETTGNGDRVCLFGRLDEANSYQFAAPAIAPRYSFTGRLPRRFVGDQVFAV